MWENSEKWRGDFWKLVIKTPYLCKSKLIYKEDLETRKYLNVHQFSPIHCSFFYKRGFSHQFLFPPYLTRCETHGSWRSNIKTFLSVNFVPIVLAFCNEFIKSKKFIKFDLANLKAEQERIPNACWNLYTNL